MADINSLVDLEVQKVSLSAGSLVVLALHLFLTPARK